MKSNYQEQCNSIKILNQLFGATYTPANMVYDLLVLHSANLYPSTIFNTHKDAKTNNNNYKAILHHITRRSVEHCTPHADGAWLNELGWSQ